MMNGNGATLCVVLLALLACAASQCYRSCNSNADCTADACTRCASGFCQVGVQCSESCNEDSDCAVVGPCGYCTNSRCQQTGGGTNPNPPPAMDNPLDATKTCIFNLDNDFCGPPSIAVVEANWKPETCAYLSREMEYQGYFDLGCVSNHTLVRSVGSYPSPDCGWKDGVANSMWQATKQCVANWNMGGCSNIRTAVAVGPDWSREGGFSIGDEDGSYPPSDCGWANATRKEGLKLKEAGGKICFAWDPTLTEVYTSNVNPLWTFEDCYQWGREMLGGVSVLQVGCIFTDHFSIGAKGGGLPSENCGWSL